MNKYLLLILVILFLICLTLLIISLTKCKDDFGGQILNAELQYNAAKLNSIFNKPATKKSDLLFFHCLDVDSPGHTYNSEMEKQPWDGYCKKDSQFFWCPVKYAHLIGKIKVPLKGISFSAFNSSIHRKGGRTLCCKQYGFIFHYPDGSDDNPISPMCYFPTDGSTLIRGKCGCGKVPGLQKSSDCPLDSGWKNLATCDKNKSGDKLYEDTILGIHSNTYNAINELKLPYTALQCSTNFNQFMDLSKIAIKLQNKNPPTGNAKNWNEVVIPSWSSNDIKIDQIPLKALFYTNDKDASNMIKLARLYYNKTGYSIPVVKFDPKASKDPFKQLTGY